MATTIPADELEGHIALWSSSHGALVQRISKVESTRHGRVLTFHHQLTLHFSNGVARLRRQGHGVGDWSFLEEPTNRTPPEPSEPPRDHEASADRRASTFPLCREEQRR
jgi:hypothetical protein